MAGFDNFIRLFIDCVEFAGPNFYLISDSIPLFPSI